MSQNEGNQSVGEQNVGEQNYFTESSGITLALLAIFALAGCIIGWLFNGALP